MVVEYQVADHRDEGSLPTRRIDCLRVAHKQALVTCRVARAFSDEPVPDGSVGRRGRLGRSAPDSTCRKWKTGLGIPMILDELDAKREASPEERFPAVPGDSRLPYW
eukprot:scaffold14138_cov61-Phaeocystis_antarctica.AAC.3